MAGYVFVFIAELLGVDNAVGLVYMLILHLSVHFYYSTRHRIKGFTAGSKVRFDKLHGKSGWRQPLRKMFWIGPHLEHQVERSVEAAIDNELLFAGRCFFQVFREPIPG